ncbi:zinc finger protein 771-like [Anopheles arabiensis]|uniref:zinc finger protein 771-like n=1 Tax=Anopheles arabiensis TaxID=7173 RepID=UPI001AAC8BAE|nr:zinc finger protein 771-like [Anopheles arabiensis]
MQTCVSCRVKNNGMIAIFQHPNGLDEMFHSITDIKVQPEEHLCVPCYDDLKVAYRFKQRCIQNTAPRLSSRAKKTTHAPADQSVISSCTDVYTTYDKSVPESTINQNTENNSSNGRANTSNIAPEMSDPSPLPKIELCIENETIQQDDVEISEELIDPLQDEEDQPLANYIIGVIESATNDNAPKDKVGTDSAKEQTSDQTITAATQERGQSSSILPKLHSLMCEYCFKEFTLLTDKIEHTESHKSEAKPFKCVQEGCGKSFKDRVGLRSHVRIHSAVRRFGCRYCPRRFHTLGNQVTHERTHSGEKPFICPKCGKGFAEVGNLKNHIRFHTGERPYACNLCDKSYRTYYSRTIHMRSHTNERPYLCGDCGKGFYSSGKLTIHRRTHTGERPYECTSCTARFSATSSLRRHMVNKH